MSRFHQTKVSFILLCYTAFLDWMSYGLVYPIFAAMIFEPDQHLFAFGSSISKGMWLGILVSASPLAQFFSSPFVGRFSDRLGRKPILQGSSLTMALGYLLSACGVWQRNLCFLILGRVITGIGASNISIINSAMSDISHPSEKSKRYALLAMYSGLGFSVGPLLGGKLSLWGFEIPFIGAGLFTLFNLILITFLFTETRPGSKNKLAHQPPGFHSFLNQDFLSKFRVLFPAFFVFCLGWGFFWEFIPVTWILEQGLNVAGIGHFYAYGSAFYVLSSGLLIRPIVKKFPPLPILFFSLLALGGVFFILLMYTWVGMYWICIPIQQFLIALVFPVGTAIVSNLTAEHKQGEMLGAFQSLQSFAFAVIPFLGGMLLNLNVNAPLIVGCIAMVLASLILLGGHGKKLFRQR